ncbi:MAG: hypothetical protein J6336_03145 [Kiritimatiellae bacterium]|nr:hypothetical protein [Kiritimatiellia bacterium]
MMMRHRIAVSLLIAGWAAVCCAAGPKIPAIYTVPHELDVLVQAGHVQGACCSEKGIYLAHQFGIEKIGWDGKRQGGVKAPAHLGDIGYADGRIYGAFVLRGVKNDQALGMIRVWDEQLNVVAEKTVTKEGLDGAVVIGDTLYCGIDRWGGNGHPGAAIAMFDLQLNLKGVVDVDFGYWIHFGVQTMATDGKDLFCGNYGVRKDPKENPDARNTTRLSLPGCSVQSSWTLPFAEGFCRVPDKIAKRTNPVFFCVRALGGNMQGWRKDPANNPPRIRIDFYEYDGNGHFEDITER